MVTGAASPPDQPGPAGGTRILALELQPTPVSAEVFTSVSQTVDIDPGCCYTLSFTADVRDGAIPLVSVSFPQLPLPTGTPCPPSPADIVNSLSTPNPIPHIVLQGHTGQSSFLPYTLVVCVPDSATVACITFQNILVDNGNGGTAFIDNVVFQPTGGGCDGCVQNFI
ncbi:hypothetical protein EMIT019CA3_130039 [Bacillus pseudomycoides]|uniref:Uncharacterized protein n=1 Tax=Bacillus pseudomycoides TaxID=64104 RepID=A0ABD6T156_9BACI|nr:hypothetical protein bmyco0003_10000 [Bacillus pseudomycoides]PDZ72580.1 hypothetical protein CON58_17245 [Bacillus pseudomycoides]PGF05931.1 hypothetical protein COM59_27465 [Bacillus pseudomycoides]PHE88831.1 hypothetical protein COF81_25770 [Bacillus pseudomycoides]